MDFKHAIAAGALARIKEYYGSIDALRIEFRHGHLMTPTETARPYVKLGDDVISLTNPDISGLDTRELIMILQLYYVHMVPCFAVSKSNSYGVSHATISAPYEAVRAAIECLQHVAPTISLI